MDKIKLFLSSRVNSNFQRLDTPYTLEALRSYLRKALESATYLDEQLLEIKMNEESFDGTLKKDAFDTCLAVMRSSNIIVILYNGEAGWALAGSDSSNGSAMRNSW
jgi:hypothetical protein